MIVYKKNIFKQKDNIRVRLTRK